MLYLGYFLFLKYKFKFYFFNNKFLLKLQKNIIINFNIKFYNYIVYFLKKSYIFFYFILKDLTSVDNNINLKYNNILTYWLFFESNLLFFENLIFIFFLKKNINSLENFFFNAKWLEKENLDNFGLNYKNKKDQRNLFLKIPISVIFLCPWLKLMFSHLYRVASWRVNDFLKTAKHRK